ncbi:MAG: CvpA family protein [Proteobacteria bacterium]|jgi:membrane protein required for colicin V production|nr:CvpA family protein [Pseudomonadota bacterium]MBU4327811.1 CvpA family protein [Pseudomonadota bacterium]
MDIGFNMTAYDLVIIAIFVFFMARGIWVGLLGQVTVLVALYVGYLVSGQYHDKLFPFLRGVSENPQVVFLLAYAIVFACTYVLTMLLGKALTGVVQLTIAGWFDKVLGALFGAIKALILAILLHMLLTTFLGADTPMLRQCQLCPYLSQAMTLFQQVIKDEKVRKAFEKKEPAISDQTVAPAAEPVVPLSIPAKQVPVNKTPVEKSPVGPLPSVQ